MEEQVKKAPAKKTVATRNTEIVLGSAAVKIAAGVKSLNEAVSLVNTLEQKAQDQTLIVVNLEDKIGGLEQDLKNKIAQNKIELDQAFTADQKSFVEKWMKENNMTCILVTDLNKLRTDLTAATTDVDKQIAKAVAIAENSLKAAHLNEMKIKELELSNKEANNTAKIAQLEAQNTFLQEQIDSYKEMLETQMKNETERAKYGQISTLNVGEVKR